MESVVPNRSLLAVAGLAGALGVALAAAASHRADANLGIAGNFLLFHAPVLLGLSLLAGSRLASLAGWLLAAGLAVFAGDLVARALAGQSLFPFAAPIGGGGLLLGWLLVIATALFGWPKRPTS
jgi:uncharacterized membrane protein YgdD (TMEM256/DUF423 family)